MLSSAQLEQYRRDGYLSPVPAFSTSEAADLLTHFEKFERHAGDKAGALRTDVHLLQQWAWDIVTTERVLDPVRDILGDDVLLWSTNWFIKEPGDGKLVSLHQDANYWGLAPHDVLTAWIALTDADPSTGPMRFVPGSHKETLYDHDNTYAEDNLLSRGQTIQRTVTEEECQLAPLRAGEMSLHHVRIVHGSDRNTSDRRRIGMVLRYCATWVKQTKGPDTAVLVSGQDRYGHFELLPKPETDNGRLEMSRHHKAVAQLGKIINMD